MRGRGMPEGNAPEENEGLSELEVELEAFCDNLRGPPSGGVGSDSGGQKKIRWLAGLGEGRTVAPKRSGIMETESVRRREG